MVKKLFLLFLPVSALFTAKASDTLHVITHNRQTVVTDPAKGEHRYNRWGVFPPAKTPIRKITLHVRFACPDTMRCADWDYLDFISIKRVGGANGANKDFEIARMLTPYGGAFGKDWSFDWEVDVTDFRLLLRDSVEIEYNHTGYEPATDRGWSVTLDFEIIKGVPVAEPIRIEKVYGGAYPYGDAKQPIETFLKPYRFEREKGAHFAKFRIAQTGHGANRGDACGEFCSKWREVVFNGATIDKKQIWKECSTNPLYPQAGTWIHDRAAWCPGDLQAPDEYLLSLQERNTLDVNMEPYEATPTQAVENITAYLIQYKKAIAKNDAAIVAIQAPSHKETFARSNPSCAGPRIVIRNNGSADLTQLDMVYATAGHPAKKHRWKGRLSLGGQTEVSLPGMIDAAEGNNHFTVALSNPNGKKDEYPSDNSMTSLFQKAPVHGGGLVLAFKTNQQPAQNRYLLQSSDGKILYQRQFDSSEKNLFFLDTLRLAPGCYELLVTDSGDNGLEFWANPRGGSGYVRLQDVQGNLLKTFNADFGRSLQYRFMVSNTPQEWSGVNKEASVGLYPTRTNDKTTLDYFSGAPTDVLVQLITDPGATVVEEHRYPALKEGVFTYDLRRFPRGRFYLVVLSAGQEVFRKRVRLKE